ncbi:MAG: multicopper oxidase family protein [Planctomycetes bacterium]|nr:multicopper oxidase family protein [Planctomycetota bacterium]
MSALRSSLVLLAATALGAQDLQLPRAVDYNPDPKVFETVLIAHETEIELVEGTKTRVYAYNGSVPGPTIEANLGDTLIVHFLNLLNEPTVLHWHGVEMPAVMDGSHIAQQEIPRYGYFRYQFKLNNAATYWYHSHKNTNEQVERGLHGALVVRDPRHDAGLKIAPTHERVVFLDDVKLDGKLQIEGFGTDLNFPMVDWQRAEDQANSRPGTHLLVNGRHASADIQPTLEVMAGEPYRIRFINVSSGEIFRLDTSDPNQKWFHIGSDQGLWNEAEPIPRIDKVVNPRGHHNFLISNPDTKLGVTLTPSDRHEIVIVPEGDVGDEFFIDLHDFVKGAHVAFRDPQNKIVFGHDHFDGTDDPIHLIRIRIAGRRNPPAWKPPSPLRYDPYTALVVDPKQTILPVVFGHGFPDVNTGNTMFFVNVAKPFDLLASVLAKKMTMPPAFGPMPMMMLTANDGYKVKVGEVRMWEIVNFTGGDHNFHTHGFRFQQIETQYIDLDDASFNRTEKAQRLTYEDTIRVPMRPNLTLGRSFTIVRLAAQFDDSAKPAALRRSAKEMVAGGLVPTATTSGGWLVHCHFLEHARLGMMSFIQISE